MKLFIIVTVCFGLVYGRLPAGIFPKCTRHERDLAKCLLEGVEAIRPLLIDGIPEVAFPSLEPFRLAKMPLDVSLPGLKLRGEATNIEATGAGDFIIEKFSMDFNKMTADVIILFPKLDVTADYSTKDSKMLFFNVASAGRFTGSFNNVKAVISARGKLDDEDGLDYVRVPFVNVKVVFGKGSSINIDPQGNNRIASKWAAKMVNMAPTKLVLKMLQSGINKTAGQILKKYINRVLDEMPLQDILEDKCH